MNQTALAEELSRLARFSAVGAIAPGVHNRRCDDRGRCGGVSPTVGATTGFLSAFTVSYVGHFRFSFAATGRYRDYLLVSPTWGGSSHPLEIVTPE